MKLGRGGMLRYNGYECYMEYDPELDYPAAIKKADAEFVKEQNDYFAEQRRLQEQRHWHDNFATGLSRIEQLLQEYIAQSRKESEQSKQDAEKRKLERAERRRKLEAEQRKLERAERRRKLEAKWKANDELFFITYGVTREEAMAGKMPKFYPSRAESNKNVIPHPPKAVVHEEVDIHIVDSATEEFIEVPNALTNDVVPVATIASPLQVPDHSDEIADVTVDIGVDPIAMPVDLIAESIVVQQGIEPVHSEGSKVHSAILVVDLKALQAPHVYVDPYLQHCRPLDFVVADFSTRAVPCFCDVVILSFTVVEWTYGSKIFVFDPG